MKEYLDLCNYVLNAGEKRLDRTNTGTISCFGYQTRYDLTKGFPLLTTKKVHFKSVALELLWFIKGETNIRPLVMDKVKIWNDWPFEKFKKSVDYNGETMEQFIEKICVDEDFANQYGDLGPVYGKQWRDFNGTDQLIELIDGLKNNPFSRRHILCAWNPSEIDKMALPPCHAFVQFYVSSDSKKLSLQLYQRSADVFLGVPFNIASYALLLEMVAHVCGYKAYEMVHTFGDVHIYQNHLEQINTQLVREPRSLPTLKLNPEVKNITDFVYEDFEICGYDPHDRIQGKVAV